MFADGMFTIQDEASQLIGFLVNPEEGQTVADACAGPGGKLSHVYELGEEKITLIAIEKDEEQYQRAKDNMERMQHPKVDWVKDDFLNWQPNEKIDKVLLDALLYGARRPPPAPRRKVA